ncbi:diguanylate cyclase domain-containing protein [Bathymodiolus platifrons methanotrophic gill symbiont]|uniref:diguanylate cyclase domain-containing protein n=1 Tax=Bathymodiolus platifrons methanotrophic gill symbiont TaxID=113268 RepID=UPI0021E15F3A|nr:sensor domain-containing diguanylate cyclase [Bathymodiolus platifrons methanotrophic gill symbiont]
MDEYIQRTLKGEIVPPYQVEVLDSQGEKRSLKIQENPAFDNDGRCIELSGIAHDITPLIQTREQITLLSYYDDLTGLANNRLFSDRVEQMINLSHRQHQSLALLFIDLDGFKLINDRFGHATGDSALKETANRLSGSRYFCESLFWASQPKQAAKT